MTRAFWKAERVSITLIVACFLSGKLVAQTDTNEPESVRKENAVNEQHLLLEEIRTVAQALNLARTGRIATNLQTAVPAAFGTLPLPEVTTPIKIDGKLDEYAWQNATSLPVGPIFADWRDGPFMVQVSACRDEAKLYIAIYSPQDLSLLGTNSGLKALFKIGDQPFLITKPSGKIQGGIIRKDSKGQTIELALPLPAKPIQLTFYTELVRRNSTFTTREDRTERDRIENPQPGIREHQDLSGKAAWLDPVTIKLVSAPEAIKFKDTTSEPNQVQLSYTLKTGGRRSKSRTIKLQETGETGVYRYRYALHIREDYYEIESCLYVEPVEYTLGYVREILSLSANQNSSEAEQDEISKAVEELGRKLDNVEFSDRKQWRRLYCEARLLKAKAARDMPRN